MSSIDLIDLAVRYGWLPAGSDLPDFLCPQKGDQHAYGAS